MIQLGSSKGSLLRQTHHQRRAAKSVATKLVTRCSSDIGALQRLYRYTSFQCSDLLQPNLEFQQLYQLAHSAQIELEGLLGKVAMQAGVQLLVPAVKGEQRAKEKITTELAGNHRALTDLARATLIGRDINQVAEAYSALLEHGQLISLLNRFHSPKANGYRDLKVLLRLPKSGMVAEVQIHLRAIEQVKNGEEHRIYQQLQKIERLAEVEGRDLSQWELAKINRLRRFSRALYEEAWQRYLPSVASSSLS